MTDLQEMLATLLRDLTFEQRLCVEFGFRGVLIWHDAKLKATVIDVDRHAHRHSFRISDHELLHSRLTFEQIARIECNRMAHEMKLAGSPRTRFDQIGNGAFKKAFDRLSWEQQRVLERTLLDSQNADFLVSLPNKPVIKP